MPPPFSAFQSVQTLNILDGYDLAGWGHNSADYLHHLIEAWKVRDANRRIADPALWPVDLGDHLSTAHAAQLFRTIDPRHAGRYVTERDERDDAQDESGQRIGRGTTAFVVADASGDMIAVTQTLSTWGGNFYVSEGLGFLYNNHLRGNRTTRGAYGHLLPLLRSSSASTPTLVFRDDGGRRSPLLAVGAAGNAWIAASVYGVITTGKELLIVKSVTKGTRPPGDAFEGWGWFWYANFSPDGKYLATADGDGIAHIWDAGTGEELHALKSHRDEIYHIEFSPDGSRLVTVSPDGLAIIWDVLTGEKLLTLSEDSALYWVVFSPDGSRIAFANYDDGWVSIWDAVTGERLRTLVHPNIKVESVSYSPDGRRIVTTSNDHIVRI